MQSDRRMLTWPFDTARIAFTVILASVFAEYSVANQAGCRIKVLAWRLHEKSSPGRRGGPMGVSAGGTASEKLAGTPKSSSSEANHNFVSRKASRAPGSRHQILLFIIQQHYICIGFCPVTVANSPPSSRTRVARFLTAHSRMHGLAQ